MNRSLISVPNALTFLRFLGIPLFIYLTLSLEADGWAIVVLAVGGRLITLMEKSPAPGIRLHVLAN